MLCEARHTVVGRTELRDLSGCRHLCVAHEGSITLEESLLALPHSDATRVCERARQRAQQLRGSHLGLSQPLGDSGSSPQRTAARAAGLSQLQIAAARTEPTPAEQGRSAVERERAVCLSAAEREGGAPQAWPAHQSGCVCVLCRKAELRQQGLRGVDQSQCVVPAPGRCSRLKR